MYFSVIIPTKDRRIILEESLERLSRVHNLRDLEVIIINDDANPLVLEKPYDFAVVYDNTTGSGVASARNYGASKAKNDWLIFMDDDMWVQPDTFQKLYPFTVNEERCLNVNWIYPLFFEKQLSQKPFLRYLKTYGFDSLQGWSSDVEWNTTQPFRVKGITSQFLLIHKSAFEKAGRYDSSFPHAGFEDHDFSKRLKNKGIEVYVDPRNMIYHNEADRLEINNWLERKKRGAVTRKVGVSLGYKELQLQYPIHKKIFYRMVYFLRPVFLWILQSWPNTTLLDRIYFLFVNVLLGTYSCVGYTSRQAQQVVDSLRIRKSIDRSEGIIA